MSFDTQQGTVLKKEGTYFTVKLKNESEPSNVQNTLPISIDIGDKVIIDYVESLNNPIIVGVYNKELKEPNSDFFCSVENGDLIAHYRSLSSLNNIQLNLNENGELIVSSDLINDTYVDSNGELHLII